MPTLVSLAIEADNPAALAQQLHAHPAWATAIIEGLPQMGIPDATLPLHILGDWFCRETADRRKRNLPALLAACPTHEGPLWTYPTPLARADLDALTEGLQAVVDHPQPGPVLPAVEAARLRAAIALKAWSPRFNVFYCTVLTPASLWDADVERLTAASASPAEQHAAAHRLAPVFQARLTGPWTAQLVLAWAEAIADPQWIVDTFLRLDPSSLRPDQRWPNLRHQAIGTQLDAAFARGARPATPTDAHALAEHYPEQHARLLASARIKELDRPTLTPGRPRHRT